MTVAEKRNALANFCGARNCYENCPLASDKVCSSCNFNTAHGDAGYMTDAEIIGAYEIVFGKTAVSSSASTVVDDNAITICGINKIQNISILLREDK